MAIYKFGEALTISANDIQNTDVILANPEIEDRFTKFAKELKTIAPKAKDFLYFSAIMMHAAEAALLDEKGEIRKHADGTPITAKWENAVDKNGKPTVFWKCSDASIKPYKNKNGDIFSEAELLKAYKNWVGKPLCLDHKSASANDTVGIIIDTYYDYKNKNIVALCALDKINYPEMARKVASGYATCVSMGVGCGRAVCSEPNCYNVATIEAEFCHHMKNKTCYGEVNLDLNPIELSIVVNGADPKAKIRQVVAAANSIAKYIDQKDFIANNANSQNLMHRLDVLTKEIEEIKKQASEQNLNKKDLEIISDDDSVLSFLSKLAHNVEELTNKVNGFIKENQMADKRGYWQGTEEPSPNQTKYQVDPMQKDLREKQDKQLTGASPFPNTGPVDGIHPGYSSFGESEEARKKRLKRASEEEDRKLRREAVLKKAKENLARKGWFNGGEEPTPGKQQYPVDPMQKDLREKQDKHLVGQPPFPNVGPVDGLHPSPSSVDIKDEAKRKEMLQRASYKARFFKGGTASTTRWEIHDGDKLILTATLQDMFGDKADFHYDQFASQDYAKKLMKKIRAEGVEAVSNMIKKAQAPAAPATPIAPQTPAEPSPEGMSPEGMDAGQDDGGSGDPSENLPEIIDEIEGKLTDLRQGVNALTEKGVGDGTDLQGFKDLTDAGALPPTQATALAMERKLHGYLVSGMKETYAKLADLKNDFNKIQEIAVIAKERNEFKKHANDFKSTIKESMIDANNLFADVITLKQAFLNYARTRNTMIKRAEMASKQFQKKAQSRTDVMSDPTKPVEGRIYSVGDPFMPSDATPGVPYHAQQGSAAPITQKTQTRNPPKTPQTPKEKIDSKTVDEKLPAPYGDRSGLEKMLESGAGAIRGQDFSGKAQQTGTPTAQKGQVVSNTSGVPTQKIQGAKADDGEDENDLKMNSDGSIEGTPEEVGKAMKESKALDLSTKEKRAEARVKLAQKALKFSDMLKPDDVHRSGYNFDADPKPSGNLAHIETLEETHNAMMSLVNAPPKVRKTAEQIRDLIAQGSMDETMFPGLIAEGIDPEAIKYYKTYLAQSKDGGSQYAADLLKDYGKKKAAEDQEAVRVKVARVYEVIQEAVEKGAISGDKVTKKAQFDQLMKFNDENFEHFASWISGLPGIKKSASIPNIGGTDFFGALPTVPQSQENLANEYAKLFVGKKY